MIHAAKGSWHAAVGATISPDPGATALDKQLAGLPRAALLAKLSRHPSTRSHGEGMAAEAGDGARTSFLGLAARS
jgi:hypothetical protein